MKRVLYLIVYTILISSSYAGEKISHTLDSEADGLIEINLVRGEVEIAGWQENRVQVEGVLDDYAEKFVFERDQSGRILVEVELQKKLSGGQESKLQIRVPSASRVEGSGVSTDYSLRDTTGTVELQSVSGDLVMQHLEGDITAKSISGDVTIEAAMGEIEAISVSGDIRIDREQGMTQAVTVSGDILVSGVSLARLSASNVSGDIKARGALTPDSKIEMETVSGDIQLTLVGEIDARFDLATGPGGDIRNKINDVARPHRQDGALYNGFQFTREEISQLFSFMGKKMGRHTFLWHHFNNKRIHTPVKIRWCQGLAV